MLCLSLCYHAPVPTQRYPLSLHDALPISGKLAIATDQKIAPQGAHCAVPLDLGAPAPVLITLEVVHRCAGHDRDGPFPDRKSTRLNSSHVAISYAVFCLKKKNPRC